MIASKYSLVAALLVASCSAQNLRRKLPKNEFCKPVPLFVEPTTGLGVYDADVFFVAITNGKVMDPFVLEEVMVPSYNNITDCSYLLGSTRELLECEAIPNAESPDPNSILVKCNYLTNTKDPFPAISYQGQPEAIAKCACTCKADLVIEGLFLGDTCSCFCDPHKTDCECIVPSVSDYIGEINAAYANSTALLEGEELGKLIRVYEVPLLDHEICGSPNTTSYNLTGVCPGLETPAFAKQFTLPPTDAPTDRYVSL